MKHAGADRLWPFAEGGESNLAVATAVWAGALIISRRWSNPLFRLLGFVLTIIYLLILYFFRDPNRPTVEQPGMVVGPGDGEVVNIVREHESEFLNQESVRISIFLSVLDVHVQRIPIGGKVLRVQHHPGQFLQAYRPEASQVNEYIATILETPYGLVLVKQIAGIMARRCVNYLHPGETVYTGERLGLIRFGSRVDLFLPADARLLISIGDKVIGGITPLARLKEKEQPA
jgi:phosphatidylserine decarboxylase